MKKNLHDMRENYAKGCLEKASVDANPSLQFAAWFEEAKASAKHEANAMHLSTVNSNGQPEGRLVLLKQFSDEGFVFFTHYSSAKGQAIADNNRVALTFFWPELERQVRIEGLAVPIEATDSDEYFYSRPLGSQVGAAASPQSQEIASYSILEQAADELTKQGDVKRPEQWGGYKVVPHMFEFWQGRPNRLHDRIKYVRNEANMWGISRLAP